MQRGVTDNFRFRDIALQNLWENWFYQSSSKHSHPSYYNTPTLFSYIVEGPLSFKLITRCLPAKSINLLTFKKSMTVLLLSSICSSPRSFDDSLSIGIPVLRFASSLRDGCLKPVSEVLTPPSLWLVFPLFAPSSRLPDSVKVPQYSWLTCPAAWGPHCQVFVYLLALLSWFLGRVTSSRLSTRWVFFLEVSFLEVASTSNMWGGGLPTLQPG